jgi:hypothetical protein
MSISENVRAFIREKKYINITQLGEMAGIKKERIHYLMNAGEFNADEFMNICYALGEKPEAFIDHE